MSNDPFNFRSINITKSSPATTNQTSITTVASSSQSLLHNNNNHNNHKDAEDLHQWSLFRQNLNANFSETVLFQPSGSTGSSPPSSGSSSGLIPEANQSRQQIHSNTNNYNPNKMNGTPGFPLRESTVNNILSHPKYGAQLKNQDAFTYLRFGLPRVKTIAQQNDRQQQQQQNQPPVAMSKIPNNPVEDYDEPLNNRSKPQAPPPPFLKNPNDGGKSRRNINNGRLGDRHGSSAINEELKKRFWGSDPNLLRNSENESDSSGKDLPQNHNHGQNHRKTSSPNNSKAFHNNFNNRYNPQQPPPPPSTQLAENRFSKPMNKSHLTRSAYNVSDVEMKRSHNYNNNNNDPRIHSRRDMHRNGAFSPPPTLSHQQHSDPEDPVQISPFNTDNEDELMGNLDDCTPTFIQQQQPQSQHQSHPPVTGTGAQHQSSTSSSLPPPMAKYPHLVVKDLLYEVDKSSNWRRMCGFSRQKLRILEDISFDVRGGELMAIMATSANEGTALLNVLGCRHDHRNGTARAEIYLNGVLISPRHLSRMMAYVTQNMHLCSNMSARQALLFVGLLMGPASRSSTDVKRLTRTLLEELNLGEVKHTKITELTHSERRRLHIAMHLLLDTELLLIDQPLLGLDIFDSFFMVEYLRQWAMVGGRTVIMTISPPTFEVFTMIHRVLLISAGRALYVGPRKDFLKYFSSLGYPCPPFKNPSDYYLDLVTLDDLSQEALMESSQRIETLADIHARRSISEIFSSMPGPPAVLPAPYRRANFAMQFLALWIRALIFSFPYNVVDLFTRFMITLILSLMIGGIYWQIRTGREQEFVWDRIGFINTMISIGVIPVMAAELINAYSEKKYILSEVYQGFYSLPSYLLAKLLYSTPQTVLIGLAYALPSCSMAGLQLHSNPNSLPFYLLLMISYFTALRSFIFASVWICNRRSTAACFFGFLFTIFLLSSGVNIQYRDLSITHRFLRQISPVRWLHEAIVAWEFEPNVLQNMQNSDTNGGNGGTSIVSSFLCSRNPVIQQPNAILVRADCGFQTRANILKWFEYQGGNVFQPNLRPSWHAFVALLVLYLGSFLFGSIIFCLRIYYYNECPPNGQPTDTGTMTTTATTTATNTTAISGASTTAIKHR